MRKLSTVFLLVAVAAGCGGSSSEGSAAATLPDLSRYNPSKLAGQQMCEEAVTNYERQLFASTTTPVREKNLFDSSEANLEHRRRVDKCTISFSERQAACFSTAPSLQYVQNCELYAELQ